jgi:hypothetical protein
MKFNTHPLSMAKEETEMVLRSKYLLPVLCIGILFSMSCNENKIESSWPQNPIQIDGQADDWNGLPKYYFEESGIALGIGNDADNAYLLFRFTNPKWLMSISQRGLTIWLDGTAKKKKDFSIRYSGKIPSDSSATASAFQTNLSEEQRERLMKLQTRATDQIAVFDAKEGVEVSISADGMRGPSASLGSRDGVFTYEFAIPLQKSGGVSYAFNAKPGQKISIGLEFGGVNEEELQHMREQRGHGKEHGEGTGPPGGMSPPGGTGGRGEAGGPGGMGPPGGMGRPGGRGRPGGSGEEDPEAQMKKLMEGEKIWVKVRLAPSPAH